VGKNFGKIFYKHISTYRYNATADNGNAEYSAIPCLVGKQSAVVLR
jgi:hypothetical protein